MFQALGFGVACYAIVDKWGTGHIKALFQSKLNHYY